MKTIRELIKDALRLYNRATRVKTLQTMEEIEANTENHCLAGAGAVAELNNKLAGQLSNISLIAEGSGENIKYFAQLGADTASKKPLGDIKVKHDIVTITAPNTAKITVDGTVFAVMVCSTSGHIEACFIKRDNSLLKNINGFFGANTIDNLQSGTVLIHNNQGGIHAFEYLIFYR